MKRITTLLCLFVLIQAKGMAQTPATANPEKKSGSTETLSHTNPEFPGGIDSAYAFFYRNFVYPKIAYENRIEGKNMVSFFVETDGSLTEITLVGRGVGWGLDEEEFRVIRLMPKWKPATVNGTPMRTKFVLPIKFLYPN